MNPRRAGLMAESGGTPVSFDPRHTWDTGLCLTTRHDQGLWLFLLLLPFIVPLRPSVISSQFSSHREVGHKGRGGDSGPWEQRKGLDPIPMGTADLTEGACSLLQTNTVFNLPC